MILSVVVPTRDKRDLLERTLAALRAQELTGAWEVVVVDDGSGDGTADLLAAAARRPGPPLRVVAPGRNVGRAAARNLGARAAAGRWLLFLDDDIVAPPGLLAAHAAQLARRPGCGTIGLVRTDPELLDAPHLHYVDSRGAAKVRGDIVPARYFVTQNAAVPRADFLAVGGFDERFRRYGLEDVELAFRLEDRRGTVFLPVRRPVPSHVHHQDLREYLRKRRLVGRASLTLLARLHPGRIAEMRLHWVVDPPGARPGPGPRLLRVLVRLGAGRLGAAAASIWPRGRGARPWLPRLYFRLMDAVVLACYREGLLAGEEGPGLP